MAKSTVKIKNVVLREAVLIKQLQEQAKQADRPLAYVMRAILTGKLPPLRSVP